MAQRYRQSIILLGVLAVAFAWYFGFEKTWKQRSKEKEESGKQLVSLKKDDVTELEYVRVTNAPDGVERPADFAPIVLEVKAKKIGKDWHLTAPVEDLADNGTIEGMIATLVSAKHERVVEEAPKTLETFGLDHPAVTVTIKGGGRAETVKIGANTPVGYSSYAIGHGQTAVWRVSKSVRTSFDKDIFALRNKLVLPLSRSDLQEVEVQAKGSSYLVKKESGDKWVLAREGIPADSTEWSKALNLWLDARAISFPETKGKSLAAFGLDTPRAKVTFTKSNDGGKIVLLLGKATLDKRERYFAKRPDKATVFEVDKTALEAAERPSSELLDKQLARFNRFEISRIKVSRRDGNFELTKDDKGAWTFVEPKTDKKVDVPRVDALLTKLQDTKVLRYEVGKPKLAAGVVATTLQLFAKRGNEEKEAVTVRFGAKRGKTVAGDRSDAMAPFVLDAAAFAPFDVSAAYYHGEGKTVGAPEKPATPDTSKSDSHDHGPDDGHGHG
jgi:hypothetical protein